MEGSFTIRAASSHLDDGKRILDYCDNQLPWLAKVGSKDQWGIDPFSNDEDTQERYRAVVRRSEQMSQSWRKDWTKAYIAEANAGKNQDKNSEPQSSIIGSSVADTSLMQCVPVAAMILEGHSEHYVRSVLPEQDDQDPFIYVRYLLTDRRLGSLSKGAGLALLDHAKSVASDLGIKRLCLDAWSGNERKLVRYYERNGFTLLGDVSDNGWPAAVLELRL